MHENRCLLYESGELDGAEAAEFERHLKGCAECRERLALVRRVHRASGALAEDAPRRLVAAVVARARPEPAAVPWLVFLRPLGLAAGAAFAAALLMYALRGTPRTPAETEASSVPPPPRTFPERAVAAPEFASARTGRPRAAFRSALDDAEEFRLRGLDADAARVQFPRVAVARPRLIADVVPDRPAAFGLSPAVFSPEGVAVPAVAAPHLSGALPD